MTEEEALKTCTGWVNRPNIKGHFPFAAANFLVGTGKYGFEQSGFMGYVLRLWTPAERAEIAASREKNKHGGALEWLDAP